MEAGGSNPLTPTINADIWLKIGKKFKEPVYQKHCWAQVNKYCNTALKCYKKLLPEFLNTEEKTTCGHFFGTLSELAYLQNATEKAQDYNLLAASLLMGEAASTQTKHTNTNCKFWHCINPKKLLAKTKYNDDTLPLNDENILSKKKYIVIANGFSCFRMCHCERCEAIQH